jgi:hypothetical protein
MAEGEKLMDKTPHPITKENGVSTWEHKSTDNYLIIGKDALGKPFRKESSNPKYMMSINVYTGNLWLLRDGRKYLIKSWSN